MEGTPGTQNPAGNKESEQEPYKKCETDFFFYFHVGYSVSERCDIINDMEMSWGKNANLVIKTKTGQVSVEADSRLVMSHRKSDEGDFVVTGAGEYEVEGISVFGYQVGEQIIFVIQGEEVRVLWLGELATLPDEKIIGKLENIDVLVLGCGGLENKAWVELIGKLEPYYVIPLGEQKESFIAAYEHGSRTVKSLNVSRLSLTDEVTEVIVFE